MANRYPSASPAVSRSAVVARLLSGAVCVAAYVVALSGGRPGLGREVAALGGSYLGAFLCTTVWSLAILTFGRRAGLEARVISWGLGPAFRTVFRGGRVIRLCRIPAPLIRVQVAPGPDGIKGRSFVAVVLLVLAVQGLMGGGLLLVSGPFGVAAGTACLGLALVSLGKLWQVGRSGSPGSPMQVRSGGADLEMQVMSAVQHSAAEARQVFESRPEPELRRSVSGRTAEMLVLIAEGRYREAMITAAVIEQAPDASEIVRVGARLSRARSLAYAMEATAPEPGDRETFLALCRELRDVPAKLTTGSDLRSLYYLATGDVQLAVDEAKAATRVGSAPLRRSLAYATLALACHRAGRGAQAQKALRLAERQGCDYARLAFVAGVVLGGSGGSDPSEEGRPLALQ